MRRVVVTGLGVACPLGTEVEAVASAQREGVSGAGPMSAAFAVPGFAIRAACRVPGWHARSQLDDLADVFAGCGDRKGEFGLYAATRALRQAFGSDGEARNVIDGLRGRAALHTASGLVSSLPEEGETDVLSCLKADGSFDYEASFAALQGPNARRGRHFTDRVNHLLAWYYGFSGPALVNHGACAAGAVAIGTAARWIRRGRCDLAVAGGFESMIHPFGVLSFHMLGALSERSDCDVSEVSRPFDRTRDGFVIGEGAGMLVLESEEHARSRGAEILGVVHGLGTSLDSYRTTAPPPDGRGAVVAMRAALREARLEREAIGWINAHGTGTPLNDSAESAAIRTVFGDVSTAPPVTSSKSAIGHAVAAAGAVEAVLSLLALRDKVLPPTLNLHTPDPECDLDYVPLVARDAPALRYVLSNSFGFGGVNGTLVLGGADT
ncbi:MAG: beta-ketoacyl-[acyl-carrier-protein] synthase family protein [Deltaproteobacteria bacterium]|nr:beta-ketoacyl-[acyl-carrier-protein] synthase family protein [Deltaproteobacteria bacterium]